MLPLCGGSFFNFYNIMQAARERELRSRGGEEELEVSRRAWEVNYREAAIFLEEGQNNDKFIHHPRYLLA